jgi:hypothetical protein
MDAGSGVAALPSATVRVVFRPARLEVLSVLRAGMVTSCTSGIVSA